MKLIFAVLDVSSTVGLTRCYKTEGFYAFIYITTLLITQLIIRELSVVTYFHFTYISWLAYHETKRLIRFF